MTSADWWRVGARLLGVYFVVLAGIYAANALGPLAARALFLVSGASELAHVLIDSVVTATPWELRSAQLTSGIVDFGAGAALTFAPLRVAGFLGTFAGQ
jgi:uncharacterized membrane protein HdeD (DUF308 family)